MKRICEHVRICGRVQGVCFRYYTQQQASLLGICGWVRNCADGIVEAMICGEAEQLEMMKQWLRHGPSEAEVTSIAFSAGHLPDSCNDFRIV